MKSLKGFKSFYLSLLAAALVFRSLSGVEALIANEPVSSLLSKHADNIASLKKTCEKKVGLPAMKGLPYSNDVFFLRYCLAAPEDTSAQTNRLRKNLDWRMKDGRSICAAATSAIREAMAEGAWNNEPVLKSAPNSDVISKYIKPSNVITTTSSKNDLVYCIRAGSIEDASLMEEVTVDQMVDFFLYAKEVNAQIANIRSELTDELKCVITANDLTGVKLVGGSADFRKALSQSSNIATELYPATAGPTLLLNLPGLLSALAKLFTPLFSKEVKDRLKFQQGPLKDVSDLQQVATSASGAERTTFVKQLDEIIYAG